MVKTVMTGLENKDWDPNNITSGRCYRRSIAKLTKAWIIRLLTQVMKSRKGRILAGNTGEFHRDLAKRLLSKVKAQSLTINTPVKILKQ